MCNSLDSPLTDNSEIEEKPFTYTKNTLINFGGRTGQENFSAFPSIPVQSNSYMDNRRRNCPGLEDYGQYFMKIQFTQFNVNFSTLMICSKMNEMHHLFGLS